MRCPCPLVDRADVLIYDAWAGGDDDGGRQLVNGVRDKYCDLPVILTSVDGGIDWGRDRGPAPRLPSPRTGQHRPLLGGGRARARGPGLAV